MSLNKTICFVVSLIAIHAAVASEVHCPAVQRVHGKSKPLEDASVFSGPPEELAQLMPDLEKSEWDIAQDQLSAKKRVQSMYLVCHYEHSSATIKLRIPGDATLCKVEGTASGTTAAWCKTTTGQSLNSKGMRAHGHQS